MEKKAAQKITQELVGGPMPQNNYYQQGYPPAPQNPNMYQNQNYYGGPPPPINQFNNNLPQQPPTVVIIDKSPKTGSCQFCHVNASILQRHKSGCATWGWCFCLLCFAPLCCWIPFVVDDCYDINYICTNCQGVRGVVKSTYGC
jgi:hypothetical protein